MNKYINSKVETAILQKALFKKIYPNLQNHEKTLQNMFFYSSFRY